MPEDHRPAASPASAASTPGTAQGRRLWRMRKLHQTVDAELRALSGDEVELRYTLNGEPTFRRCWPSRDEALREAMSRRAELEREGWSFHW